MIKKELKIFQDRTKIKSFGSYRYFIMFLLMFLIILVSINYVSAYKRLCLTYGQVIPNEEEPRYTCRHDICQICVTDNNYPTHPSRCDDIEGCEVFGNSTIDKEPPQLTVNFPVNDKIYDSRNVFFDIKSNEPVSIYYTDNNRVRWKKIASLVMNYARELSFKDGLNDITIKAVDRKGNFVEIIKKFYVDSKKPKISKTSPKKGFANGEFEVEFSEENPKKLVLRYGNGVFGEKELDINDCLTKNGKYFCNTQIALNNYNGQNIEYWFELEDIAGNKDESKHIFLSVDTTPPVINNPHSFWVKHENHIIFDIQITENNFDEAVYSYNNGKIIEKKICSKLKDGKCVNKKSFKKGAHVLDIEVRDKAGNAVSNRIEFDV